MSDVPTPLDFVDPLERDDTYRVVLWASPGQGKSVAAASAPSPILVLTADRPSAYRFARKHHGHTAQTLRETRFVDASSLDAVFRYLSSDEGKDVRTVVVDPVSNVYDHLVDTLPLRGDGEPNYQTVNKKVLGFVQSLRRFDINVVLVAHEKLNDGRKGDGKLYPALGGPSLINKLLAEMDLVAHIERVVRTTDDGEQQLWVGQLQPRDNLVCKESTGALGDRRVADLSRWFQVASEALAPDDSDLPFVETEADLEHAEPEELKAA
jgi:hypothetical protein